MSRTGKAWSSIGSELHRPADCQYFSQCNCSCLLCLMDSGAVGPLLGKALSSSIKHCALVFAQVHFMEPRSKSQSVLSLTSSFQNHNKFSKSQSVWGITISLGNHKQFGESKSVFCFLYFPESMKCRFPAMDLQEHSQNITVSITIMCMVLCCGVPR